MAEALIDGPELDAVEVGRRLPPRVRVPLQDDAVRRVARDQEGSRAETAASGLRRLPRA